MDKICSIFKTRAGFAAIDILIVVGLLGGTLTAVVGTKKSKRRI